MIISSVSHFSDFQTFFNMSAECSTSFMNFIFKFIYLFSDFFNYLILLKYFLQVKNSSLWFQTMEILLKIIRAEQLDHTNLHKKQIISINLDEVRQQNWSQTKIHSLNLNITHQYFISISFVIISLQIKSACFNCIHFTWSKKE